MFADVVMGFPKSSFERKFDDIKEEKGVEFDTDLTAEDLKEVVAIYKEEYKKHAGVEFPQDPKVQLMEAIKAVFRSWNNDRAITYRRLNDIPGSWGTAVNVQQMVYGIQEILLVQVLPSLVTLQLVKRNYSVNT